MTNPESITFFVTRNMTDVTEELQFQSMNSLKNIAEVKKKNTQETFVCDRCKKKNPYSL